MSKAALFNLFLVKAPFRNQGSFPCDFRKLMQYSQSPLFCLLIFYFFFSFSSLFQGITIYAGPEGKSNRFSFFDFVYTFSILKCTLSVCVFDGSNWQLENM